MSEFYNILKRLRESKELLQKDVANDLGISPASYSLYEKGLREPSIDMLIKIANYFNVTIDYLMGHETNDTVTNREVSLMTGVNNIAAHFSGEHFTDEEAEKIKEFAEFVKSQRRFSKGVNTIPTLNAAHERTDVEITDDMREHDEKLMDEEE